MDFRRLHARFSLLGPFGDPAGQAALERGMPRVRHDLISSGSRPEIARSVADDDLKFLRQHILGIVSRATGIPVGELDIRGLSLIPYSDEAELEGEE